MKTLKKFLRENGGKFEDLDKLDDNDTPDF